MAVAEFVHVAAHDERVETDKGDAVLDFEVGVGGRGQGGRRLAAERFGQLLDADDQSGVDLAAGDGQQPLTHGRAGRAAGRFQLDRLHAPLAEIIGHERAQMALAAEAVAIHVADVDGVEVIDAGVGHCRAPGFHGQLAQRQVPVLTHRRLSDTKNGYFSHGVSRDSKRCSECSVQYQRPLR
jgi:hypothetical protein